MTKRPSKAFVKLLVKNNGGVRKRTADETITAIRDCMWQALGLNDQERNAQGQKVVALFWSLGFSVESAEEATMTIWEECIRIKGQK